MLYVDQVQSGWRPGDSVLTMEGEGVFKSGRGTTPFLAMRHGTISVRSIQFSRVGRALVPVCLWFEPLTSIWWCVRF